MGGREEKEKKGGRDMEIGMGKGMGEARGKERLGGSEQTPLQQIRKIGSGGVSGLTMGCQHCSQGVRSRVVDPSEPEDFKFVEGVIIQSYHLFHTHNVVDHRDP